MKSKDSDFADMQLIWDLVDFASRGGLAILILYFIFLIPYYLILELLFNSECTRLYVRLRSCGAYCLWCLLIGCVVATLTVPFTHYTPLHLNLTDKENWRFLSKIIFLKLNKTVFFSCHFVVRDYKVLWCWVVLCWSFSLKCSFDVTFISCYIIWHACVLPAHANS